MDAVDGVAGERDPAVAELEQVARGQLAALDVVDRDRGDDAVRLVDEHHRDARRGEPALVGLRRGERDREQAVDAADHRAEHAGALLGALDVEEHELVAAAASIGATPRRRSITEERVKKGAITPMERVRPGGEGTGVASGS